MSSIKKSESRFHLHFKPTPIIKNKIIEAKLKSINGEFTNYQPFKYHQFRDEYIDFHRKPYIINFKPESPSTIDKKKNKHNR